MYFKRKRDLARSKDGTLLMKGEWYDSEDEANDEDIRPWLIDQIRLPIPDPKNVTVELMEEHIAKRADELEPGRADELAPVALDEALPADVKAQFGRNQAVDANAIRDRVRGRRNKPGGRS